jgi:recombination protein RecT
MGAITQAKQEIQQAKQPDNSFAGLIKRCAPQLQAVMPKGCTTERLTHLAIAAYKQTPKLSECSVTSILSCCLRCAELGLMPNDAMGSAYVIPQWNSKTHRYEAEFRLGKNGMLDLVKRHPNVIEVYTQCVYEGDDFTYFNNETGHHFTFTPNFKAQHDEDKLVVVYLVCELKNGSIAFDYMMKDDVDKIKKASKAGDKGPWATYYEAMAEKSVIRHAFQRGKLPYSVETADAVNDDGNTPVILDEEGNRIFEDPLAPEPTEVPANVDAETGEIIDAN